MSNTWLEKKGTPWAYREDADKKLRDGRALVINLGDKGSKGTHWVAARKVGRTLFYADPFGTILNGYPPKEIRNGVDNIVSNRISWQRPSTGLCGYYAYLFTKALDELPETASQKELEEALRRKIM